MSLHGIVILPKAGTVLTADPGIFGARKLALGSGKSADDPTCYGISKGFGIVAPLIETRGPDLSSALRVIQSGRDMQFISIALYAAFQQVPRLQCLAKRADIAFVVSQGKMRISGRWS
ncbi:hypothetical protein ACEUZ9_000501 [Paracoccus litorisediminis]|uniref:hypothetical protein n=1 Tax=Paracoccus litorisediminis TaxID=2006130 RepID=UPI0037349091